MAAVSPPAYSTPSANRTVRGLPSLSPNPVSSMSRADGRTVMDASACTFPCCGRVPLTR